jgi:hypothetical protein
MSLCGRGCECWQTRREFDGENCFHFPTGVKPGLIWRFLVRISGGKVCSRFRPRESPL